MELYCFILDNTMQTVSITPKWQLHIPIAVRKKLNLKKPSQADIFVRNQEIVVRPRQSRVLKLAGKYKGVKPVKHIDLDHVRDFIDYSKW